MLFELNTKSVLLGSLITGVLSALLVATAAVIWIEHREVLEPTPVTAQSREENPALDLLPEPVWTSSSSQLRSPPLAFLNRVKGDPTPLVGERALRLPILMYHHIRDLQPTFTRKERYFTVTPAAFGAQMEALKRAGYQTVTPRDLGQVLKTDSAAWPDKPVLITLDDGYREHYEQALPVLQRLGLQATFFIVSRATALGGFMTPEMLRAAEASGLVTIAAHTQHHPFLTRLRRPTRVSEIQGAKRDLEEMLGHTIQDFAYPYGAWNQSLAQEVEQAGYALGFGVRLGSLHTSSSRYNLRRIRVLEGEDIVPLLDQFAQP